MYLVLGKRKYELIYDRTYYDVRSNELLAHIDGSGFLEIATNKSSLKNLLNVKEGEIIRIETN
jgi:S-adenosylmethionine hydrolase